MLVARRKPAFFFCPTRVRPRGNPLKARYTTGLRTRFLARPAPRRSLDQIAPCRGPTKAREGPDDGNRLADARVSDSTETMFDVGGSLAPRSRAESGTVRARSVVCSRFFGGERVDCGSGKCLRDYTRRVRAGVLVRRGKQGLNGIFSCYFLYF